MPTMSPDQLIAAGPSADQSSPPKGGDFAPLPETPPAGAAPDAGSGAPNPTAAEDATVSDTLAAFDKLMSKPDNRTKDKVAKAKPATPPAEEPSGDPADLVTPVEPKVGDKAKEPAPKAPVDTQLAEPPPTAKRADKPVVAADDVGLVPEPILKQMSNQSKEWAISQAKRLKELETSNKQLTEQVTKQKDGSLPDSWYEHPNAYVLMPEFQRAQANIGDTAGLLNHYRQQLIAVKEGEKWIDIVEMKDGTRKQVQRDPSVQAEELLMDRIGNAKLIINQEEGYVKSLVTDFTARHQQAKSILSGLEDKYFPQYTKEIKGSTPQIDNYVAGLRNELNSLNLGNDKLTNSLLKLYAFSMEQLAELNALKASQSNPAITQQVQRNAGPTAAVVNNGGAARSLDPDEAPFNPSQWPSR